MAEKTAHSLKQKKKIESILRKFGSCFNLILWRKTKTNAITMYKLNKRYRDRGK